MARKFNWNIFKTEDGKYIQVDLNDGCNCLIPLDYPETLAQNKAEKKAEIERFATFTKTTVTGMELLD